LEEIKVVKKVIARKYIKNGRNALKAPQAK
jgi:hypothetical protein